MHVSAGKRAMLNVSIAIEADTQPLPRRHKRTASSTADLYRLLTSHLHHLPYLVSTPLPLVKGDAGQGVGRRAIRCGLPQVGGLIEGRVLCLPA